MTEMCIIIKHQEFKEQQWKQQQQNNKKQQQENSQSCTNSLLSSTLTAFLINSLIHVLLIIILSVNLSMMQRLPFVLTAEAAAAVTVQPMLAPIRVSGTYLLNSQTNERFFVKGVTYRFPVDNDNQINWKPALDALLKSANQINTIMIYEVEFTKQYDLFMKYCLSLGVYVTVPLTPNSGPCVLNNAGSPNPSTNANPSSGAATAGTSINCYPSCLLNFGQNVMNMFSQYNNTLSFVVGYQVVNSDAAMNSLPCVKAYVRDLKTFQKSCSGSLYKMRSVPFQYIAADVAPEQVTVSTSYNFNRFIADYLTCQSLDVSIDIFSLNTIKWCSSGCRTLSADRCTYTSMLNSICGIRVPFVLSEFGCANYQIGTSNAQREWYEALEILQPAYNWCFAGGNANTYSDPPPGRSFGASFFTPNDQQTVSTILACGDPSNTCNLNNYQTRLATAFPTAKSPNSISPTLVNKTYTNPSRPYKNCTAKWNNAVDLSLAKVQTRQSFNDYVVVHCPGFAEASSSKSLADYLVSPWVIVGYFVLVFIIFFVVCVSCRASNVAVCPCCPSRQRRESVSDISQYSEIQKAKINKQERMPLSPKFDANGAQINHHDSSLQEYKQQAQATTNPYQQQAANPNSARSEQNSDFSRKENSANNSRNNRDPLARSAELSQNQQQERQRKLTHRMSSLSKSKMNNV